MTSLAAPQQCGQFLPRTYMAVVDPIRDDFADKIGSRVGAVFLVMLLALFACGYLWRLIY